MKKTFSKGFDRPDERREFQGHGHLDMIAFEDGVTVGRGVFEPGWKWSNDVKPIAGTESCEAEHLGYCLKGNLVVRMNSGEEIRIRAGEGPDAFCSGGDQKIRGDWVEGSEPCELLDFAGYKDYAKPKGAEEAA